MRREGCAPHPQARLGASLCLCLRLSLQGCRCCGVTPQVLGMGSNDPQVIWGGLGGKKLGGTQDPSTQPETWWRGAQEAPRLRGTRSGRGARCPRQRAGPIGLVAKGRKGRRWPYGDGSSHCLKPQLPFVVSGLKENLGPNSPCELVKPCGKSASS